MRSFAFIAALFCFVTVRAQDCLGYYFLQNNKTIEMTIYNKKGKEAAKQVYKVSNVKTSDGSTVGDLNTEMFDEKGKTIAKGASVMKCVGGVMMIDMKLSLPQQQTEQFQSSDVKADNIYIEYPSSMNVGDQLKDAKMDLEIENAGGMKQSVNMEVKERQVTAKEKVTTTAGSWDCYKIAFKSKMRIKTIGIGIPVNIEGFEWFAPGFGIVKTESKHGTTAITSIQ